MIEEKCSCGGIKDLLDVEFNIKENSNCWFSQTGKLCKECFKNQSKTGQWKPRLIVGLEFINCSICERKKEECICKIIVKEKLKNDTKI